MIYLGRGKKTTAFKNDVGFDSNSNGHHDGFHSPPRLCVLSTVTSATTFDA